MGYLIGLINNKIKKKANHKLENHGITVKQGRFLGYLHDREGFVTTQKDLQAYFDITHPTTVGIIKRLEQKELITTRPDEGDRRMKIVELAPKEKEIHVEMKYFKEKMETLLLEGIDNQEKEELIRLLEKVYENVKD